MTVTLINKSARRQLLELRHPTFYRAVWGYHVQTVRTSELNPKTGNRRTLETKKKSPGTLTLLGGQRIVGLPDDIMLCPDVEKKRRAGLILIAFDASAETGLATASSETTAHAAPEASTTKRRKASDNA